MCGIFGAVNTAGYFNDRDYARFIQMTELVRTRGPNSSGNVALSLKDGQPGSRSRFDVFLGHRRLSIIDLSENGNQPMRGDGGAWITFNGEIYNYLELKKTAGLARYPFRTCCDTESILAVYETLGEDAFEMFNGEWAFGLADPRRRRVVLSRDRFSIKPLYYTWRNGILYFGSEIKQLLPLLPRAAPNSRAVHAYLNQGLLDFSEETLFHSILQLKPKTNMVIAMDGGEPQTKPYWTYTRRPETASPVEATEQFRALLADSVRLRLRSDVKIGAIVSGGLDSSALAVLAQKDCGAGLETFSVAPLDERYSEARFVETLRSHCNLNNRILPVDEFQVIESLEEVLRINDEPLGSFSAIAHYRMMQTIRSESDVTVLLSGQGGDEILLGYRKFFYFYLRQALRQGRIGDLVREAGFSAWNRTVLWQFHWGEAKRYLKSTGTRRKSYLPDSSAAVPLFHFETMRERQIQDLDHYSVPLLAHYEDRNAMAFSMEMRLPFLDHRLVDFCLNLDVHHKLHRGWTKYILRQAVPELPAAIRWRRDKQGFTLPEEVWLRTTMRPMIENLFANSVLDRLGLIDAGEFRKHYREFREGRTAIWCTDISRLLMAELWARRHFDTPLESLADTLALASVTR